MPTIDRALLAFCIIFYCSTLGLTVYTGALRSDLAAQQQVLALAQEENRNLRFRVLIPDSLKCWVEWGMAAQGRWLAKHERRLDGLEATYRRSKQCQQE